MVIRTFRNITPITAGSGLRINQDSKDIKVLIRQGESLALEFKSDVSSLPDRDLIAAAASAITYYTWVRLNLKIASLVW